MPFIRRDNDHDDHPADYADTVFVSDITRISGCEGCCEFHIELCDKQGTVMAVSVCDVKLLKLLRDAINDVLNKIN